jgi:hypothetical protein
MFLAGETPLSLTGSQSIAVSGTQLTGFGVRLPADQWFKPLDFKTALDSAFIPLDSVGGFALYPYSGSGPYQNIRNTISRQYFQTATFLPNR